MRASKKLVFKEIVNHSFLKTVSAFANFGTGKIFFGVSDDGQVIGLADPEQSCLAIENSINDNIKPRPNFLLSINTDNTITLEIAEGLSKPYLYKGKAYRRSDSSSVEVDQVELKRLILFGENIYFEELPYSHDVPLSFNRLEEQLDKELKVPKLTGDVLKTLGLYTKDGQFNNAAGIFADKNTFPGVDIIRFGRSISEILERQTVDCQSLFSLYEEALIMFRRYYQYQEIIGSKRQLVEKVPEKAFREVLANALVHRTWDVQNHIRIAMFDEHIEIHSPGGLPPGISEEEYLNGYVSSLKNPVIGSILFRLNYIEMFGTGIGRINDLYRDSELKPSFNVSANSIQVILPVVNRLPELSTDEKVIFDLLADGRKLASSEIVAASGFSKHKVIRLLNDLIDKKYTKVEGQGRGTRYKR
ncbi:MAG: AAA family ATPase [Alcaligenaceae bacterium]|jgi:ATP-dependent DNA helicase RecG|nr:AAA family ATPase [Alcaligenaceae bacterium]